MTVFTSHHLQSTVGVRRTWLERVRGWRSSTIYISLIENSGASVSRAASRIDISLMADLYLVVHNIVLSYTPRLLIVRALIV